jgi:hypothetical protein
MYIVLNVTMTEIPTPRVTRYPFINPHVSASSNAIPKAGQKPIVRESPARIAPNNPRKLPMERSIFPVSKQSNWPRERIPITATWRVTLNMLLIVRKTGEEMDKKINQEANTIGRIRPANFRLSTSRCCSSMSFHGLD